VKTESKTERLIYLQKETKRRLAGAAVLLGTFALWTAVLYRVDVRAIGPRGSEVGLATLNAFVHGLTGVNMTLYTLTDWLGLVPVFFGMGFGVLGAVQWLRRRRLGRVDANILILGGFYLVVLGTYLFFETVAINYRPVLIDGFLEASYPSSTTLLVLCVMPTARLQLRARVQNRVCRRWVTALITAFTVFMVAARLVSGVHWISDIVGGCLLSGGLVLLYRAFSRL